ncbi:MAG: hypothetical protein JZU52_04500 [Lamprocystis purpurea]|jgi:hypothetical protein|uniref:DUF5672 family protein n=1 Tax=Lamprocystis purpurea TaxID=61598 RepID=UPI0012FA0E46|nr:DUF5672 family protein [Lamprocystis purpurea]MBV5272917.1 hypothetical protein [Lamprocystis purpurea]
MSNLVHQAERVATAPAPAATRFAPTVVVVVPIYRLIPTDDEHLSLSQLFRLLRGTDIVFIHPQSLNTRAYQQWPAARMSLEDRHFRSSATYSRLLLSSAFYRRYRAYEFVLIHQTDAFLCHNDLSSFTRSDIDYIGAPWMTPKRCPPWCLRGTRFFTLPGLTRTFVVGNGGLSLRRVTKFIEVIESNRWYSAAARLSATHEDIFFSSLRGDAQGRLRIPDRHLAISFSFDRNPRASYAANEYRLPFGLHNPWGYDREFFLREILPQCGDLPQLR